MKVVITGLPITGFAHSLDEIKDLIGGANSRARISYEDPASLRAAFAGADAVIHLAGILIERPGSNYEQANVAPAQAVVDAAEQSGVKKIVLISATGADETSSNRYYRTKGQAEALVKSSGLAYSVLRAPLLLGRGTEGAAALERHARVKKAKLLGGGRNLQQPLDVDDLALAAIHATDISVAADQTLDVVGPTALPDWEIVERAGRQLGKHVQIGSLPIGVARLGLWIRKLLGRSGFSLDALEVITADTNLDPRPAASALGIQLTEIDDMIEKSLGQGKR